MSSRKLFGICGSLIFVVACSQTDAGITTNVKSRLITDDSVKANQIDVEGTVMSAAGHAKAVEIAKGTESVHHVVDRLTIGPKAKSGS